MSLLWRWLLITLLFGASHLIGERVAAQISTPGNYEKLRQETIFQVRNKVNPILAKYCHDACQVIDVQAEIDERISEIDDLGFEGVVGDAAVGQLFVSKVTVEVEIDDRVTMANRDRLRTILANHLRSSGVEVDVVWRPVTIPQIGESMAKEEELKRSLENKMSRVVEDVIQTYCPESCVLSQVAVDGSLLTADEARSVPKNEIVRDQSGYGILRVNQVDVEINLDERLREDMRSKIINIMEARTRFVSPVDFNVQVVAFPESYASRKEKAERNSADPYGLGKLRETLKIFRELAGTKEVITNNMSTSQSRESMSESSALSEQKTSEDVLMWALLIGGFLLVAGIIVALTMKFASANRDARLMMQAADYRRSHTSGQVSPVQTAATDHRPDPKEASRELSLRMKCEELRDELTRIFLDAPRVAKETFSRLISEEGVEETAKYVHIFGHMVVFELLQDPNLHRDLYELSEYYHKSKFDFSLEETYKLLLALKTRVTASEIRVLARKQMNQFDFLSKLDATQIFNLIAEEKPQVQSIVLTQLDHKRRRAVFDMYQGQAKVDLMRELCRADAIPKEYLFNVAKALHKKVVSRPEFDTENLRSSDILLDLLEKAELHEQRALMGNLLTTNPEAARGIKLRLVTLEMLPYLKDGHLLEIFLGMERQDLLTFLAGTREHIRHLLLTKAPEELAESWIEDLENIHGHDEPLYRLVEMKVLGRIRSLANNGAINLMDINDMIFGGLEGGEGENGLGDEVVGIDSSRSMVA